MAPAAAALGAPDYGRGLDRFVVLLRVARQLARDSERRGRSREGYRWRVVGRARRRLLPGAQVPRRTGGAAADAALVQVGSVLDVDVGLRAARGGVLPARRPVSGRSVRLR